MRFVISEEIKSCIQSPVVGNVYNVRGGTGAKNGHVMVIVGLQNSMATVLVINKDGEIVGGSNYGQHYFEEKCPIAFCAGLEDLSFRIERLGQC